MNHLLRTLTESQVKPAADLRLLLTTVKEARKQFPDAKLSDPFYDALEGLLVDLKTITVDNRDAEAFLKPVSRAEVPDYYDVISNPMDFQTMLKKVKQKSYRSKREFKDDLDLIWSNCYTYNASENHPLRRCVDRLQTKAESLLKHITDRKDRTDPHIPHDLPLPSGVRPKLNGTNGHINGRTSHTRSPSVNLTPTPARSTSVKSRQGLAFPDTPAIVRTPEGMATFVDLNKEVGSSRPRSTLAHTLRDMAPTVDYGSEPEDENAMVVDKAGPSAGEKRKLNGSSDLRPRKRARFTTQYPTPLLDEKDDLSQLWWGAVQSDSLLANGLPGIPFGPSSSVSHRKKLKVKRKQAKTTNQPLAPQGATPTATPQNPKSLVVMMNNNIKTLRRVRHTHAKFAALSAATMGPEDEEGAEGGFSAGPSGVVASRMTSLPGFGVADDDVVEEKIDERPWLEGRGRECKLSGIDIGGVAAGDCLSWATEKILEHSGFQGTSSVAQEVLAGVASEYLLNVGRTIRYLMDQCGKTMTPEEIILHTLFESGTSKVQDLERYVSDDIERSGGRLAELEKKLVSAYRETTANEILDDEGLFEEESDGETGALAMGEFADLLGEDYLGLRELGIADEFGLQGLSIPRKLLKGKKGQNKPAAAKPTEPPPPFPPPPPFIPFTAAMGEEQIGLLKPYYQSRFTMLVGASQPVGSTLFGPTLPGPSLLGPPSDPSMPPPPSVPGTSPTNPPAPTIPPDLVLPDDTPSPAQLKMSPIGQIIKTGAAAAAAKKKAAAKTAGTDGAAPGASGGGGRVSTPGPGGTPGADVGASAKKKKGNTGVGSGNGRKKKPDGPGSTPTPAPVFGGHGSPMMPAVVTASA